MRDYSRFDQYINDLQGDIYPQPVDEAHLEWACSALEMIPEDVETVLDVGCGEGFLKRIFDQKKIVWNGITLGEQDYEVGRKQGHSGLFKGDFTFTHFSDEMFDLVFARHALEHSPFPIPTLKEWRRVSSNYLLLVAPAPQYWGWAGANHYSVANENQLWWWLTRTGWKIIDEDYLKTSHDEFMKYYLPEQKDRSKVVYPGAPKIVEFRYLCQKVEPIKE
jgi:SAM-dependent methyltransferase